MAKLWHLMKDINNPAAVNFLIFCFCRECINQVCEAAGLKSVDKKRKVQI